MLDPEVNDWQKVRKDGDLSLTSFIIGHRLFICSVTLASLRSHTLASLLYYMLPAPFGSLPQASKWWGREPRMKGAVVEVEVDRKDMDHFLHFLLPTPTPYSHSPLPLPE